MSKFNKLKNLFKDSEGIYSEEDYNEEYDEGYEEYNEGYEDFDEDYDEDYEEFDEEESDKEEFDEEEFDERYEEEYEDFNEDDYEGDNDDNLSWNDLTAEEQMAVELAKEFIKDGMSLHKAVFLAVEKVNNANVEEEYIGEDFYEEEADFDIVYSYMKQREEKESN